MTSLVLLQLRTFAAAGRLKTLAFAFVTTDVLVVMALTLMAIFTKSLPLASRLPTTESTHAYNQFLWLALAPLDLVTLVANLRLVWVASRDRRTYGQSARMPKLMVVVLRDNIVFLMVHVVLDLSFRNCESNNAIEWSPGTFWEPTWYSAGNSIGFIHIF